MLLTLVTADIVVAGMRPICNEMLWIDYFGLLSLSFCLMAGLENFVVLYCWYRGDQRFFKHSFPWVARALDLCVYTVYSCSSCFGFGDGDSSELPFSVPGGMEERSTGGRSSISESICARSSKEESSDGAAHSGGAPGSTSQGAAHRPQEAAKKALSIFSPRPIEAPPLSALSPVEIVPSAHGPKAPPAASCPSAATAAQLALSSSGGAATSGTVAASPPRTGTPPASSGRRGSVFKSIRRNSRQLYESTFERRPSVTPPTGGTTPVHGRERAATLQGKDRLAAAGGRERAATADGSQLPTLSTLPAMPSTSHLELLVSPRRRAKVAKAYERRFSVAKMSTTDVAALSQSGGTHKSDGSQHSLGSQHAPSSDSLHSSSPDAGGLGLAAPTAAPPARAAPSAPPSPPDQPRLVARPVTSRASEGQAIEVQATRIEPGPTSRDGSSGALGGVEGEDEAGRCDGDDAAGGSSG